MKEAIIHVYAFEHPTAQRRSMAAKLTQAACESYGLAADQVTVYFFDLDKQSTAYAGVLIADAEAERPAGN